MQRSIFFRSWLDRWRKLRRGARAAFPADFVLPDRAVQIWQERPDLQAAFDPATPDGRTGLFWWCLLHGFRELGLKFNRELDSRFGIANEPVAGLAQHSFIPVTWLMRAAWTQAGGKSADLDQPAGQFECIAQFFARRMHELNLAGLLTADQASVLRDIDPQTSVPRLFALVWHCDPALQGRFPSSTSEPFVNWCRTHGAVDWPILAHPMIGLAAAPLRAPRTGRIRGINLFGHALGRFGIGEDARMAALTLDTIGLPYVIRNIAAGAAEEEEPDGRRFATDSPYDVDLFCMTGISTVATTMADAVRTRDGRHSIGLWPWELPEWPLAWEHAWDCIDEVWANSRYTYDAYTRAGGVPVRHMPMAVVAEASGGSDRASFGLADGAFLFGFSFDGLSSIHRKNPLAVVRAFKRAFPEPAHGVGLVLKGIRGSVSAPAWQAVLKEIGDDQRITVIDQSLPRDRLLDLYRCLDVFVSLHRSEGFGRNIAEAMLLGKPVIVTAHSGNMDFTTHDTAALVPTRLCRVEKGQYPYGEGQTWGDPDVDAAAEAMVRMISDQAWREKLAANGRHLIETRYSPQAVASVWAEHLYRLE